MKSILILNLLIILSINLYSQQIEFKKSPINGSWIEKEKGIDTILFLPEYDGLHPIFHLKRGYRIAEGDKLPDYFSGPYSYKLKNDSISIFWYFSSGTFQSYYFKMIPDSNEFFIGNFIKDPEKKKIESDTLIFMKLK